MPPEQTPAPTTQPEPFKFLETRVEKNFAPWFIKFCVVLILVGLVIAGYFRYQAYENYQYRPPLAEQSEEHATTTLDESDGWKTYQNEEYEFEIKIPPNWESSKITKELDYIHLEDEMIVFHVPIEGGDEHPKTCYISIFPREEWIDWPAWSMQLKFLAEKDGFIFGYDCGYMSGEFSEMSIYFSKFPDNGMQDYRDAIKQDELEIIIFDKEVVSKFDEFKKLIIPTFKFIE